MHQPAARHVSAQHAPSIWVLASKHHTVQALQLHHPLAGLLLPLLLLKHLELCLRHALVVRGESSQLAACPAGRLNALQVLQLQLPQLRKQLMQLMHLRLPSCASC
jgi:hypothetical protein